MIGYLINGQAKCAPWYEWTKSIAVTQRKYHSIFGIKFRAPFSESIRKLNYSLVEIGNICYVKRKQNATATFRKDQCIQENATNVFGKRLKRIARKSLTSKHMFRIR